MILKKSDYYLYNKCMENNSYEQFNKTEIELWQIAAIKQGIKDIECGKFVSVKNVFVVKFIGEICK